MFKLLVAIDRERLISIKEQLVRNIESGLSTHVMIKVASPQLFVCRQNDKATSVVRHGKTAHLFWWAAHILCCVWYHVAPYIQIQTVAARHSLNGLSPELDSRRADYMYSCCARQSSFWFDIAGWFYIIKCDRFQARSYPSNTNHGQMMTEAANTFYTPNTPATCPPDSCTAGADD